MPRSFASALRARDDAWLAALLRSRRDLMTPVPLDAGQLAARAATRHSVVRVLDQLDRLHLLVVDGLVELPEPVRYDALRGLLAIPADVLRPVVDRLADQALLWGPDEELHLVRAVRELVTPGSAPRSGSPPSVALQPPAPAPRRREAASADRTAAMAAAETVRRAEALLEHWALDPPPRLREGGVGVRDLRRTARTLDLDEATTALLVEILHVAGLLGLSATFDGDWLPTPAYDAWRREPVAHRWTTLGEAWLSTSRAPALVGERDDRGRPAPALAPGLDLAPAADIRRVTLEALATLPVGGAAELAEVAAVVGWHRPRRGGARRDALVRWTLREAETLGVTGQGALASYARELVRGDVAGCRAALDRLVPIPLDHMLLQADLTAVAPGPLQPELARELQLLAEVESTGGATVYRFSADSLRRSFDAGRNAGDVHAFLRGASRTPVPQPLSYLVDDVARRHGRLRIASAAAFVRCDDESVLAEILADRRTRGLLLHRLAPTVLAAQVAPETLLERLRSMGFAPVVEAADGSVVVPRPAQRRAPAGPQPQPSPSQRLARDDTVAAAVRAVRAGDRTARHRPPDAPPVGLARSASMQALATLQAAARSGESVWIGYVDRHGSTSERVVDPIRVDGGWLTAYDHRSGEVRTFAVHRVSAAAVVD